MIVSMQLRVAPPRPLANAFFFSFAIDFTDVYPSKLAKRSRDLANHAQTGQKKHGRKCLRVFLLGA